MSKLRINAEGRIKLLLSTLLFVYSIIVSIIGTNALVFIPMFASMMGDIFIMSSRGCITGKRENTFNFGIVCFAVAHILYIGIMPTNYQEIILITTVIFFVLVLSTVRLKKDIPSVFYAVIIILNFVNTIFYDSITMIGMILFIVSDLILAYGEDRDRKYQIPIWIFYVSAQICIISKFLLR